jgi:hypothetical protein
MSLTVYQDDKSIHDDDTLFRRVHLKLIVKDEDTGLARVSSGAFRDKDLSVDIKSVLDGLGLAPEDCITNHSTQKLVSLTAGEARRLNQAVCHDPLPKNLAHGLVYGSKNARAVLNGLTAAVDWVIPAKAPRYEEIEAEKRANGIL